VAQGQLTHHDRDEAPPAATIAPFFDDNWQVNSKLTLQMGIRWEYLGPWHEQNNQEGSFDAATGKPVWRTPREALPSWATPTVYENGEHAELVTNGAEYFRGYDPDTGKELWRIKGTSMISVPTPFASHGLIYLASGYYRFIQPIIALKPGASGEVRGPAGFNIASTGDAIALLCVRAEVGLTWRLR